MSEELRECPFCNGTHSINVINFFTRDSYRKCDICGAEAPAAKNPEEAAEKWNTRTAEKKFMDAITTLLGYIDAIDNEAKKTLPDVIDQKFMQNANPQEFSLAKIRLMVFRCKEKFN